MNKTKKKLREFYKNERAKTQNHKLKESSERIFEIFKTLDIISKTFFHIYLSNKFSKEIETDNIIKFLLSLNKRIIVPKIANKELAHYEIEYNSTYQINKYGIKEPIDLPLFDVKKIEIVLVPLLIFDKEGHRVGYGGGYYDKFLTNLKSNVIKIGLSLFDPVNKIQDIKKHDIKLDKVITPETIYEFY